VLLGVTNVNSEAPLLLVTVKIDPVKVKFASASNVLAVPEPVIT